MVMRTNLRVVTAKIESSYGTDATPAGTDAILCWNLQPAFEGARMYQKPYIKPTLGSLAQNFGGSLMTLSFDVEIRGSGTAGTAPEIDALLRACGMAVTNVPATSDTYDFTSSNQESATLYFYEDGTQYKMLGCRGTWAGNFTVGQPGILTFTMTGHFTGPTDVALVSTTFDSTVGPTLLGLSSLDIDSLTPSMESFTVEIGNSLATPGDLVETDGYGEVAIAGARNVTGAIDPLNTLVATYDWIGKWKAGTEVAFDTGVVGGTAGNRWQLTMPKVQYIEPGWGDRAELVTRTINFAANETSGDDEVSLAFT